MSTLQLWNALNFKSSLYCTYKIVNKGIQVYRHINTQSAYNINLTALKRRGRKAQDMLYQRQAGREGWLGKNNIYINLEKYNKSYITHTKKNFV